MSWVRSLSKLENVFSFFAWIFSADNSVSLGVIATVIVLLIVLNADNANDTVNKESDDPS